MGDANSLAQLDGWHSEGYAARVHYEGENERYSIEFYEARESILYWKVNEGNAAVPVPREAVPDPLRERIRRDLAQVGINPENETRLL
ncbi:DUF7538 family protein [Halocatena marina]|uniref:DUF7538 family protein n=1 Tax=Halocatena marina TaxID=2934937 RepID=UPI0020100ED5|nr:hypothetical protein [Halocatena marina]